MRSHLLLMLLAFGVAGCSDQTSNAAAGSYDGEDRFDGSRADAANRIALIQAQDAASSGVKSVAMPVNAGPQAANAFQNNPGGRPAGTPAGALQARSVPPGVLHVRRVDLIDQSGFERPVVAYTMMVPVGWRSQGGVFWPNTMSGCGPSTPHVAWNASSVDAAMSAQIIPEESWSGFAVQSAMPMPIPQQSGPCPNVLVTSGREFIHAYVQRHRPGARIIDYQDITREYANMQKMMDQTAMVPMQGMEMRSWIEAGKVLLASQENGRDMREVMYVGVFLNYARMSDMMGGYYDSGSVATMPGFAFKAPSGQLDFKLAEALRKSGREQPEWAQRMAQYRAKINKINSDGARDRARINRESSDEISRMRQETWDAQQASSDRMQRETTETILGVETYNDPYHGGTVQLDHSYDSAWQLNDGSYVLSNDAFFEPSRDLGINGSRLQRTQ